MKILVLSPGMPSPLNSGLGIAANAINKELGALADLTIVQPDNASVKTVVEENTIEIETEVTAFSAESIAQQEIEITIAARLDPYHYTVTESTPASITKDHISLTEEITRYTRQVMKKTKKINFDLIYAHDWITFQTAVALKEKTGKPFVAHVHSLDFDRGAKRYKSFVFDIERETLKAADAVIAVSKYTATVLANRYGIDPKKISVVHNAVIPFEVPKVKKSVPEKLVLFAGRLCIQKGPEIFMDIAERLASKRNDVRFVVAGGGDLYKELVERSAKAVNANFHFTGHISAEEVHELYAMADVFCMPSVSEPFGLTALEAAFAKTPVVISKDAGATEVLKGAFLEDASKPERFVSTLDKILEDKEVAKEAVEKNFECVKARTWKLATTDILEIFNACERHE